MTSSAAKQESPLKGRSCTAACALARHAHLIFTESRCGQAGLYGPAHSADRSCCPAGGPCPGRGHDPRHRIRRARAETGPRSGTAGRSGGCAPPHLYRRRRRHLYGGDDRGAGHPRRSGRMPALRQRQRLSAHLRHKGRVCGPGRAAGRRGSDHRPAPDEPGSVRHHLRGGPGRSGGLWYPEIPAHPAVRRRGASWLQRKTKKKTPEIPERFALILQKIKYVLLFGIICLCFLQKENLLNENSPWTIFSLLRAGNFSAVSNLCAILLLVIIVAGMAVKERFFCQFLCPMGAVFSLLPQFPFFRLRRGRSCLNGCQACRKNCPVSIKLQENPLRDGECISCLKCTMICPKQNIHYLPKIRKNKKDEKK